MQEEEKYELLIQYKRANSSCMIRFKGKKSLLEWMEKVCDYERIPGWLHHSKYEGAAIMDGTYCYITKETSASKPMWEEWKIKTKTVVVETPSEHIVQANARETKLYHASQIVPQEKLGGIPKDDPFVRCMIRWEIFTLKRGYEHVVMLGDGREVIYDQTKGRENAYLFRQVTVWGDSKFYRIYKAEEDALSMKSKHALEDKYYILWDQHTYQSEGRTIHRSSPCFDKSNSFRLSVLPRPA